MNIEEITPYEKSVNAVVLGGGDGEPVDGAEGPKGLVEILGRSMIEWVIDALREAKTVNRIAVVVPTGSHIPDAVRAKADVIVENDGTFTENALAGIDAVRDGKHLLGVSADVPAITGEAVDDFLVRSLSAGVDFAYPLIRKETMEAQFPGSVRTYVKIKDGLVTGGNFLMGSAEFGENVQQIFQKLFETRKNPLKMARVVGVKFVAKFASGSLDVHDVEVKLEEFFGAPCAAIFTEYASLGADVDKLVDLEITSRVLEERAAK